MRDATGRGMAAVQLLLERGLWWLQAAETALAQAAEQRAELKKQSQQLRLTEQDLRQRQGESEERESELKAFEQSLIVSALSNA